MRYRHVCFEAVTCTLPQEVVTTAELEDRLRPLYERLRLPEGRLELITGVRQRRFWQRGTRPSDKSIESAEKAIEVAGVARKEIGALVHASVCRDHLEPATACRVHHFLGLPASCQVYDVSNACLGMLNGVVQIANMIELQQIRAGIVVGTESGRSLVETTIAELNRNLSLTREDVKLAIASLTIGSGSSAILLTDASLSQTGNRLLGGAARAHTDFHELCQSGRDEAGGDAMRPLMATDSETLMNEGIQTGAATFEDLLTEMQWTRDAINKTFCHQVGPTHRRLTFEALNLPTDIDHATVEWLGNTGAAALPTAMALAVENGNLEAKDQIALLGIGSGINCIMLGVDWQEAPIVDSAANRSASIAQAEA